MLHFCTLFDSNYLDRGVLMYRSLEKHCPEFILHIFAFDDDSYKVLKKMKLKNTNIISLHEFEDAELLSVKNTRSHVEYMWTCSSSIILYVLKKFKVNMCTYVDADLIFYSDPSILLKEMGKASILLTKHNYTSGYDASKISGIYCVQFMAFKNNVLGNSALKWWRERCIEWCYAKPENGKFGDQKYLDDWTTRFDGVYVSENSGAGIAPWNLQQYSVKDTNTLVKLKSKNEIKIIFFHYHALKLFKFTVDLSPNRLPLDFKLKFYLPYLKDLLLVRKEVLRYNLDLASRSIVPKTSLKTFLKNIIRRVQKEYNIIELPK